mgnify:CR=1 FL=1
MENKTIVKTDLEIGQFLNKSLTDNRDVRLVDNSELENIDVSYFEIVDHSTLISTSDFEKIYGFKI